MIRIEDQEDVEAFKEAKAEIDDEFDEIEGRAGTQTPGATSTSAKATTEQTGDPTEEGLKEDEKA